MKILKNVSVFKLAVFVTISLFLNNYIIDILIALFLFVQNKKESLLYIFILLVSILMNTYRFDLIPIGVIEENKGKYFIVNKILYKVKLFTTDSIKIGDIVLCRDYKINEFSDIKNNIVFYGEEYKYIYTLKIKNYLNEYINNLDKDLSSVLIKQFYNIYSYENDYYFNVGYGLTIYFILKLISKKNEKLTILLIVIYSSLFNFQIKFILVILDICLKNYQRKSKVSIKILFFDIFYFHLYSNYSILLPLLIGLYPYLNIGSSFKIYISLIESFLFGEFNILTNYLYKPFIIIRIIFFIISILILIFPMYKDIYLSLVDIYSYFNNLSIFQIRGKLSIVAILTLFLINKFFNINNEKIKYVLLILYIISPIFNPYLSINFIDVGQGDAILIHDCLDKGDILIDTGSKYNYYKLKRFLIEKGIYQLDYLIITHNDEDHCGNIDNLKKDFIIKNVIERGHDIRLNKMYLKNYYIKEFENDNDNSLIYSIQINKTSFLFTGDISSDVERLLIREYGPFNIDILKASHHGSYTGSCDYFISRILPKYVIYSTSGQYNHPSKRVINTMNKYNVEQLNTKQLGNIEFVFSMFLRVIKTSKGSVII